MVIEEFSNDYMQITRDVDDIKLDLSNVALGTSFKIETYYDSTGLLTYDNDSGKMDVYSKIIWQCNVMRRGFIM